MNTYFGIPYRKSLQTYIRVLRGKTTKARGREGSRKFLLFSHIHFDVRQYSIYQ
jgi:hypothetical protein